MKKFKQILLVSSIVLALGFCVFLYASFQSSNTFIAALFLIAGVGIFCLSLLILFRNKLSFLSKSSTTTSVDTHTVVNAIQRVFKVITSEGQFTEIVDFRESKKALSYFTSTKKALIVVKASVHMGYDLSKVKWEVDEVNKVVNFVNIPDPEILSISPEINYYNIENGLFNKFSNEDFNKIQADCLAKIEEAAMRSDLPELASKQVYLLLSEVDAFNNWAFKQNGKRLKAKS